MFEFMQVWRRVYVNTTSKSLFITKFHVMQIHVDKCSIEKILMHSQGLICLILVRVSMIITDLIRLQLLIASFLATQTGDDAHASPTGLLGLAPSCQPNLRSDHIRINCRVQNYSRSITTITSTLSYELPVASQPTRKSKRNRPAQ